MVMDLLAYFLYNSFDLFLKFLRTIYASLDLFSFSLYCSILDFICVYIFDIYVYALLVTSAVHYI